MSFWLELQSQTAVTAFFLIMQIILLTLQIILGSSGCKVMLSVDMICLIFLEKTRRFIVGPASTTLAQQ